jgi:hypothetical protein
MRRRNWRLVLGGMVLIVMALVFYIFMLLNASSSTDPVGLMKFVGSISGAAFGISLVLILLGLIGKET